MARDARLVTGAIDECVDVVVVAQDVRLRTIARLADGVLTADERAAQLADMDLLITEAHQAARAVTEVDLAERWAMAAMTGRISTLLAEDIEQFGSTLPTAIPAGEPIGLDVV